MNDRVRATIADSMELLLHRIAPSVTPECSNTIAEMIKAARTPYDTANEFVPWQDNCALDRYRHTASGNLREVQLIASLIDVGVDPTSIEICTDKHTQVTRNVDVFVGGVGTFQVKLARIGSYGEMFISVKDIKGSPDYIAYVDNEQELIYVLLHVEIVNAVDVLTENEEPSGLIKWTWKRDDTIPGYYVIDMYRPKFVTDLKIPKWAVCSG